MDLQKIAQEAFYDELQKIAMMSIKGIPLLPRTAAGGSIMERAAGTVQNGMSGRSPFESKIGRLTPLLTGKSQLASPQAPGQISQFAAQPSAARYGLRVPNAQGASRGS